VYPKKRCAEEFIYFEILSPKVNKSVGERGRQCDYDHDDDDERLLSKTNELLVTDPIAARALLTESNHARLKFQ